MKVTIHGRRYDTDKATLIGKAGAGEPAAAKRDFMWWRAGLYRTPRAGRYFLAGEGGSMTNWGNGKIVPITEEDARKWAAKHLAADIEAAFGDQNEDA